MQHFLSISLMGLVATGLLLTATAPAEAGTFKRITIDGSFEDWIGVPLAYEDPEDSESSADYRRIWIANDDEYLYVRFTLARPADPFTSNDNLFIDADSDSSTGFAVLVGSELLVQGGNGYQEKNGGFNEGGINGLNWSAAPSGLGTQFEARLSRKATYAGDGEPVFAQPVIALLLEAEDANFARKETAPDSEGIPYEFAAPPARFQGSANLVPLGSDWRFNTSGTFPGDDWAQPDYDDTAAGWSSGPALFGFADNASAYPLALRTPLSATPVSHYLRTRFNWSYDADGVVLVLSNYLSDGARVFLNGAEVRRIRMPEDPVFASTPSTGSNAKPGTAEVLPLSVGPLIQGENVLAVALHQNPATPADLVFGASLFATSSQGVTFTDPSQPADRAVLAGQATTFSAEVFGSGPLSYQWLKNGQPVALATNATLTLDPVLAADAGSYSLRVANPQAPQGVLTRAALLTVLSSTVRIVEHPTASATIEGQTATFTVSAIGSAPLAYQWFKGETAIPGATNQTLTLANVRAADAAFYRVVVSNPAPSSSRSEAARLTLVPDLGPPALLAIQGGGKRVTLTFSEPIDPATASVLKNYQGTSGLAILGAAISPSDPNVVVLGTSPQTLGARYDIAISGLTDRFKNGVATGTRRGFVSSIEIDGTFGDWEGIAPAFEDPADADNATDYAAAWIFHDADAIYLRVRLHKASDFGIFYNNLFFDTDANGETGFRFRGAGSELLVQGGGGYQQRDGGFNEGGVLDLGFAMSPEGTATEFELRLSRNAIFANDGQRVFAEDKISFYLESENTSFTTVDVAPDEAPFEYLLTNAPLPDTGPLQIRPANGQLVFEWFGPGRLQASPSLVDPAWQLVPGALTSPATVAPPATSTFYRLSR